MRLTGNKTLVGNKPLVVILGATATGKTQLGIAIAQALNGEIVGADSRQVYQHMDIGTAKPTTAEREAAVHHLVDYIDPEDHLSLATYQQTAYATIEAIQVRGKLPLLVGGTGQYVTAIVEGWSIPKVAPNLALREELEAVAAQEGNLALHGRLQALDPAYAEKIHPNNVRRVVRALEVCLTTGDTVTNLQQKQPPPYEILTIGLHMEREKLYAQADHRLDMMVEAGFVEEVRGLLAMGYDRHLPAMSAVGYAEVLRHICGDEPLEQVLTEAKHNTHDFIRKQEIWFRGHDHGILWHNVDYANSDTIVQMVKNWREELG